LAWGNIRQRLLELLEQTKNFRRVIISCRTQFFPDDGKELDPFGSPGRVAVGPFRCPILFLSLFDDQRVEEYLRKRFPSRWYQFTPQRKKAASGREKASRILDKMESLRFRPLLLAHIEDLVEVREKDWNAYRIYGALIDAWLRREEGKIRKLHKGVVEKLPDKKDLLKACVKVAEFMQRQGKKTITEPALQSLVTVADDSITYLRDFNIGGRSLLNRNSNRAFRFSHYTIQEYLLAYGIVKGYLKDEPIRATDQMLLFLDLSRCKGMGLSRLDIQQVDLRKYFRKYKGDDFKGRNLRGADLAGNDLNDAFFEKADFRDADLS
ncbi:MAG: pentapeptide repeat-containing protein, partial [Gammaproteobacteria bacterium]|nr:pentapeptide repeat-containing protein [Gammaproteobacteria bacterium]